GGKDIASTRTFWFDRPLEFVPELNFLVHAGDFSFDSHHFIIKGSKIVLSYFTIPQAQHKKLVSPRPDCHSHCHNGFKGIIILPKTRSYSARIEQVYPLNLLKRYLDRLGSRRIFNEEEVVAHLECSHAIKGFGPGTDGSTYPIAYRNQ
ncbi:MAG: hypothetical protein AAF399_29920, partial [Bacteroidota bacterium]